jgi:hypothetical protein
VAQASVRGYLILGLVRKKEESEPAIIESMRFVQESTAWDGKLSATWWQ